MKSLIPIVHVKKPCMPMHAHTPELVSRWVLEAQCHWNYLKQWSPSSERPWLREQCKEWKAQLLNFSTVLHNLARAHSQIHMCMHTTMHPLINNLKSFLHLIEAYIFFIFNVTTGICETKYTILVSSFHLNCSIFYFWSFCIIFMIPFSELKYN